MLSPSVRECRLSDRVDGQLLFRRCCEGDLLWLKRDRRRYAQLRHAAADEDAFFRSYADGRMEMMAILPGNNVSL